ncbi:MAG: hypothetical protein LW832_00615, partial [Parachlamydia sp.]|nr:hypothetical protein [Parachlamydia sp.]
MQLAAANQANNSLQNTVSTQGKEVHQLQQEVAVLNQTISTFNQTIALLRNQLTQSQAESPHSILLRSQIANLEQQVASMTEVVS